MKSSLLWSNRLGIASRSGVVKSKPIFCEHRSQFAGLRPIQPGRSEKVSHPFGDLLTQHLHRKHGLSQAKLAAGILQAPSIITDMAQGKRLGGPQARERVTAIIAWLQQEGALATLDEANALLAAAGMAPLQDSRVGETSLIRSLAAQTGPQQRQSPAVQPARQVATGAKPRHNLPAPLTPFIGRKEQIARLVQQLQARRLLTLTGAGGVGKTRLAIEVAARLRPGFADGVWFVDLAPLTDPAAIPRLILDLWRVPEQPESSPLATLIAYLSSKQLVLILDNCEHLIGACAALVETILRNCPQVSVLATSREALNIDGETPWRVPSLTRPRATEWRGGAPAPSPHSPAELLRFEAVALFVERTQLHKPDFALSAENAAAVAHICSRLDGIPLAIEMAAARANVFTVEELATRLDGALDARFQLLTGGARTAPFRHQTLRATLEWSYGLLAPEEQRLLMRLSVFSGGWTATATEVVTGRSLDLLAQLVNKSLIVADQQGGQTRYRLLETVRQFAAEQFWGKMEEQKDAQRQHSRYYLGLLGDQRERLGGPQQRAGLDLIRADFANISAAWHWAVENHEFHLLHLAMQALFLFCDVSGNFRTGFPLFAQAAAQLQSAWQDMAANRSALQTLYGRALIRLGACEFLLADIAQGEQHLQEGLLVVGAEQEQALALIYLGSAASERGDLALARRHFEESLAISQRIDDVAGIADAISHFADGISDYTEACRVCAEGLALWRLVGRPDCISSMIINLAWYTWCAGDYASANAYWREGLALCEQLELFGAKAWVLDCMGCEAWGQGEMAVAERCIREALAIYTDLGWRARIGMCQADLALVLASDGRVEQAITLALEAVATTRAADSQMMLTLSLNYLGAALIAAGDWAAARSALVEAIQRAWEHRYLYNLMTAFYYVAELLAAESRSVDLPDAVERNALAVTVLSHVRAQAATWQIFKDKAAQLQTGLGGALPKEVRAAALARGQNCTPQELIKALLGVVGR